MSILVQNNFIQFFLPLLKSSIPKVVKQDLWITLVNHEYYSIILYMRTIQS